MEYRHEDGHQHQANTCELFNFQAPGQKSYIAQIVQLHAYTDIKEIINIKPTI